MNETRMAEIMQAQMRNASRNPMAFRVIERDVDGGIPLLAVKPSLAAKKQVRKAFNALCDENPHFAQESFYIEGEFYLAYTTLRQRDLMEMARALGVATSNERYELDYWSDVEEGLF